MDIILEDTMRIVENVRDWEKVRDKDILITGASGLVGSYLLWTLRAVELRYGIAAHGVYAVTHREVPEHLKALQSQSNFHFIRGDLSDFAFSESLPSADIIVHGGGYGQPLRFLEKQMEALKINVQAMFSLAGKLNAGGTLLFLSSCSVYTDGKKDEYTEEDIGIVNTDHPRICYIEGKRCGEAICNILRGSGVDAKSVRLNFTYGPGVRKGDVRAMYSFIEKAHAGDIHMLDDGSAKRMYCYIAEATELLFKIIFYGKEGVYNLASGREYTIREVAQMVAAHYGVNVITPERNETVAGAVVKEKINIGRIKKEFPEVEYIPLEEGLERTMRWYDAAYYAR